MNIPDSMREELGRWNNGAGIDLESWVGRMGNYALATGYLTLFWPDFVEHEGYILRRGFSEESLRGFEKQTGSRRKSVEWVMNHLHIADIHCGDEDELTEDKVVVLGRALKQIYEAKLARQFPHSPCIVEFYEPEPGGDLTDYEISFWQVRHESVSA
ncbi:hypothetical protein [Luteimonas deserti]|uniref:Uncharacterized protein n=1 Tax=Luteimonas deserti TaxID=2752306 RepID=A0A7Z0QRA9_9GAMM|nr:hypothetical protein [Luteimonas deserti]NYZ63416.1 hypothetical protein [Luteimonas deserti]